MWFNSIENTCPQIFKSNIKNKISQKEIKEISLFDFKLKDQPSSYFILHWFILQKYSTDSTLKTKTKQQTLNKHFYDFILDILSFVFNFQFIYFKLKSFSLKLLFLPYSSINKEKQIHLMLCLSNLIKLKQTNPKNLNLSCNNLILTKHKNN